MTQLLHLYLQANILLVASYLLFRLGLKLSDRHLNPLHALRMGQLTLGITLILPVALSLAPQMNHVYQPGTEPVADVAAAVKQQLPLSSAVVEKVIRAPQAKTSPPLQFSLSESLFLLGLTLSLFRLIQSMLKLRSLLKGSIPLKEIGSVSVALSDDVSVPFSLLWGRAWIILPTKQQIRTALALRKLADGGFAESLAEFLGRGMEESPRIFLEELKASSSWCEVGIIGNFGDYGSMPDAERVRKLNDRRTGLIKVNEPGLKIVRDQCLSVFPTK